MGLLAAKFKIFPPNQEQLLHFFALRITDRAYVVNSRSCAMLCIVQVSSRP